MTRLTTWCVVGVLFVSTVALTLINSNPLQYYRDQVEDSVSKIRLETHYATEHMKTVRQIEQCQAAVEAGRQQWRLEQWEEAIRHFDHAIRIRKYWHEAHCLKADCLYQLERYEEAVEASRLALSANCMSAWLTRGMAFERLERYETAISVYQSGLKRAPESLELHINVGWLYAGCPQEEWTDGERAVESAEAAQRLLASCTDCTQKHEWIVASLLGAAYARDGRFPEAIEFTKRAIALSPPSEHARLAQHLRDFENGSPYVRRSEPTEQGEGSAGSDKG